MLRATILIAVVSSLSVTIGSAQVPSADKVPVPAHPAAGAARRSAGGAGASNVDTVIQLVKGGMSESLVLRTLKGAKPANLSPADMLKLQKAGVSEAIINAMLDPSSVSADPATSGGSKTTPAAGGKNASLATPFPPPFGEAATSEPGKRRLAVTPFDYSTVKNWVTFWFNSDVNIGQGIRAMLTTRLQQSKNLTLLERAKVDDVMKEQDFGATNRVKQSTKAKIGKITGADALLFGDIVIFGRDDVSKGKGMSAAGGKALGSLIGSRFGTTGTIISGAAGSLGTFSKEEKAVVGINLRIVDAESGEVIQTAEARGESSRKSKNWNALAAGTGGGAVAGAGAESAMTSSNFEQTIIGEATSDAVNKVVAWLNQTIPQVPAKARTIEARVASFNGPSMYISVGANEGVKPGDRFEIDQINNEVLDPETKEVLDKEMVKVGEFVVHNVRDKVAIGEYGGQPLSAAYTKGYAARLMVQ